MSVPSFIFGGDTGLTQEQITRRRGLLEAMLARGAGAPRNVGEGLSAIGNALAYRMEKSNLAKNQTAADERRASVLAPILGGGSPSFVDPNASASAVTPTAGNPSYRDAIASIESAGSGDYSAVGPTNPKLGRALGRYQVMEANIAPWSQEALGRAVTPDEFLNDPNIQDKVFDHQFGKYVNKYGPEGAAQAWFGGPGGVGKTNRKDELGTTIGGYGNRFMSAIGSNQDDQPQEVASLDPSAGMGAPVAIEAQTNPTRQSLANALATRAPDAQPLPPSRQAIANALMPPPQTMQQAQTPSGGMQQPTNALAPPVGQQMAQVQPSQMQQQTGPSIQQLRQALMSPDLNESDRAIVGNVLQQKMQEEQATREQAGARRQAEYEAWLKQNDPKYQVDLEKSRLETENLRNPRMSPNDQANIELSREKFDFEKDKFDQEVQKGQWQKLTDGRLYNQTSGEFKDAPPAAQGSVAPKFEDVSGLRKEIHQLPSYKNIAQALPIYRSMAETADRDTKASDLNLVYGLGKIMDPTSVVREGEMVMVQNTSSIPDWLQGAIASVNGGAKMTPETRKAIMREAFGRMQGYQQAYQQDAGMYGGIVQRSGMNPADVIPNFGEFKVWEPKAAALPQVVGPQGMPITPQIAQPQPQSYPSARPRQGTPRNTDPMVIPTDIPGVTIRRKGS